AVVRYANDVPALLQVRGEHRRGVRVVVHDQNTTAPCKLRLRRLPERRALRSARGRGGRQTDGEPAAPSPPLAVRDDLAAVQMDDGSHDREAEPEAAQRTIDRLPSLSEHVEDLRQQVRRDAAAVVRDDELDEAAGTLRRELDTSARLRILRRVREQVRDNLREARGVTDHREP